MEVHALPLDPFCRNFGPYGRRPIPPKTFKPNLHTGRVAEMPQDVLMDELADDDPLALMLQVMQVRWAQCRH